MDGEIGGFIEMPEALTNAKLPSPFSKSVNSLIVDGWWDLRRMGERVNEYHVGV